VSPPRANGELVFEAPWEREVFGVTMALFEKGVFGWPEFQARLIETIAAQEQAGSAGQYYACWVAALERLLFDKGLLDAARLTEVARAYARRYAHDHGRE
jgi:nitrile hydratase accessory protein